MTTTAGVHRRLAAILCADVEGYSRLIANDPEAMNETSPAFRSVFSACFKINAPCRLCGE